MTNNAYKFMSGIEGMDRFGTGPVRSAYFMLSSTELQTDFDGLTGAGFLSQWNYPTNATALPSEYGSVFNIRILTSSEAPVARASSKNGNDIYYNTVVGKQAKIDGLHKPLVIDLEIPMGQQGASLLAA